MTLHSGFLSYYGPVMEMIRPHLRDPEYSPDLDKMRERSWTNEIKAKSNKSSSASNQGSSSFSAGRLAGVGVGLDNLGNTCYANSLLQALHHCDEFKQIIIANANSARAVCRQLARVFAQLDSEQRSFAPRDFLKVFWFLVFFFFVFRIVCSARHFLSNIDLENSKTLQSLESICLTWWNANWDKMGCLVGNFGLW